MTWEGCGVGVWCCRCTIEATIRGVQPAPMGSEQSDTIADNQDGYVKGAMERVGEDAAKGSGRVGLGLMVIAGVGTRMVIDCSTTG